MTGSAAIVLEPVRRAMLCLLNRSGAVGPRRRWATAATLPAPVRL